MKIIKLLFFLAFSFVAGFCNAQLKLPRLVDTTASYGFVDLTFAITAERKFGNRYIYVAKATHMGETLGLKISVEDSISAGIVGDVIMISVSVRRNGVVINSVGRESERLIRAMAAYYGLTCSGHFSSRPIAADAVSMNSQLADLNGKESVYRFKLFFFNKETGEEEAELYLHLDLKNRIVRLNEKDVDYRPGVLRVLTQ